MTENVPSQKQPPLALKNNGVEWRTQNAWLEEAKRTWREPASQQSGPQPQEQPADNDGSS